MPDKDLWLEAADCVAWGGGKAQHDTFDAAGEKRAYRRSYATYMRNLGKDHHFLPIRRNDLFRYLDYFRTEGFKGVIPRDGTRGLYPAPSRK